MIHMYVCICVCMHNNSKLQLQKHLTYAFNEKLKKFLFYVDITACQVVNIICKLSYDNNSTYEIF